MWTSDKTKAVVFEGVVEAFTLWSAVPTARPRRRDGKPNKPLTAFTISIEDA